MGNTVLAHVLYSCNRVNIDLQNFFSAVGDAHQIYGLNQTQLTARHLLEFPDINFICVLKLVSDGWMEVLRIKMSYDKWYLDSPKLPNYQNFFKNKCSVDYNSAWLEFYNQIKDPDWPDCVSQEDYHCLSDFIKKEIELQWVPPSENINSQAQLIEFLTTCYYDLLVSPPTVIANSPTYYLSHYFGGNFDQLINLCDRLNWKWNHTDSQKFYHKMLDANQKYLSWLACFQKKCVEAIDNRHLNCMSEDWEIALMLAKIFLEIKKDPRSAKWQNLTCFLNEKSLNLNQLIGV